MAGRKEISVIVVDVGPLMGNTVDLAAKAVSYHVQTKILNKPRDEVELITFGTTGTSNPLNAEMIAADPPDPNQYLFVTVERGMRPPNLSYLDKLANLKPGKGLSDYIDALTVAVNDVATVVNDRPDLSKKTVTQRIVLITNFRQRVKEDGIEEILTGLTNEMQTRNIALDVICVDSATDEEPGHKKNKAANLQHLSKLLSTINQQKMTHVSHPADLLGVFKAHEYGATAYYAGPLNIGKTMIIKVKVCKKTSALKLPSTEAYSDKSRAADAGHTVMHDTEYKSTVDPDRVVAPEERVKAYKYGKQTVPIPTMEDQFLRYTPERGVQLLGCITREYIPRHHYTKDTWVIVPEKDNEKAGLAMSALVRALHATNKGALLRCVFRANSEIVLGYGTPVLGSLAGPDHLLLNHLPHKEDLREFKFGSFADEKVRPSHEQLQLAEDVIRAMDLTQGGQEQLVPEQTANPIAQRFYRFMGSKALDPDAPVPEVDPLVDRIFRPRLAEMPEAEQHLARLSRAFEVKLQAKGAAGANEEVMEEDKPAALLGDEEARFALDAAPTSRVEMVGTSYPENDFGAMVAQGSVDAAASGMQSAVRKLVETSLGARNYPKARNCAVKLRKAILESFQQHSQSFNTFLRELCSEFEHNRRHKDFWAELISAQVGLISDEEAPDSGVTAAEAAQFLRDHSGVAKAQPEAAPAAAADDDEDEFAGMD